MLIYCQAVDGIPPREIIVRHLGTRLWTVALPMTGSNADVEAGIAELASWIVGRAARTSEVQPVA